MTATIPHSRISDVAARDALTQTLLAAAARRSEPERTRILHEVVLLNLPLADAVARRYLQRGVYADGVRHVARLALLNAARRFDVARARPFASFAVPAIAAELKRYFRDHVWVARPPRRLQALSGAAPTVAAAVEQDYDAPPAPADIAAHLAEDRSKVLEALRANRARAADSMDR